MKDVIDAIARVETKVDELVKRKDDHETRIRWLERWCWVLGGGGAVAGFALKLLIK